MKGVFVAGATGYLGGFVAREFKKRGYFVRALARSPERVGTLAEDIDEVVFGEITKPGMLEGLCDGMDVVFSSVGITKQKDGLSFRDVDFQGNLNLLKEARRAGARRFVYVSVFRGPELLHLDIVKAHEDFVAELRNSGMDYGVVRPTGFFSDMGDYLEMAGKGRVFLFGSGENRINPIHGADLAVTCADMAEGGSREVDVGGPEVLTHREIATMALGALGKPLRISSLPLWVMRLVVFFTRLFNRHQGELLAFLTTALSSNAVAPATGIHRLRDFFETRGGPK